MISEACVSNRMTIHSWPSRPLRAFLLIATLVFIVGALPPALLFAGVAAQESVGEDVMPAVGSEVIVVLEDGEDPAAAAAAMGVEVRHIYTSVFTGFSGVVRAPEETVTAARARRKAKEISLDGPVFAEAQFIPTGVSRTGIPQQSGGQNLAVPSPVDADIAVLDSGIADLPDLAVQGGVSCIGPNPNAWQDDNGHGTHVAGIAAAEDNTIGVVGVAPGARLWAVKVLDDRGSGSFSSVICGLDWVASRASTIDVVNLSLSGEQKTGNCSKPALHAAICAVVNAGVTVVVAAGNQATQASSRVPASYTEVITVSGIADSDGKPGRLGPRPCFADKDDMFLKFSNFGGAVDIAAPGGCIVSYGIAGQLVTESGTSEAAPHVAGAAATFVANSLAGNAVRPSPDQVRTWLLTEASRPQSVDGVTGDRDSKQFKKKAAKKDIQKAKKKKGAKGKKKARSKHKKIKNGPLEPVLWLEVLRTP